METTEKKKEIVFDALKTIIIIEQISDLKDAFKNDIKLEHKILVSLAKKNMLSEDTIEVLEDIFDNIIVRRKEYLIAYLRLNIDEIVNDTVNDTVKIEQS